MAFIVLAPFIRRRKLDITMRRVDEPRQPWPSDLIAPPGAGSNQK
jgi:hypothetical protein